MEGSRLAKVMLLTNREAVWENSLFSAHSYPMWSKLGRMKQAGENGDLVGDIQGFS